MSGFLQAVQKQIELTAAGPGQKRAALKAAEEVSRAEGQLGETLRQAFWAWIVAKKWLVSERPIEWELADEHHLSEAKVKQHYPTMSHKQAVEIATAAWEARVKRCAEHLKAGWPIEDCLTFVYTREELREALERAGRKAA